MSYLIIKIGKHHETYLGISLTKIFLDIMHLEFLRVKALMENRFVLNILLICIMINHQYDVLY
jgi:hypothetical protein